MHLDTIWLGGDLLPCPHLWDKSRALRGALRVNLAFPILS